MQTTKSRSWLRNPIGSRSRATPPDPTPRFRDGIRISMITQCFATGGVERWFLSLARNMGEHVRWGCVAVDDGGETHDATVREAMRYCPVISGPTLSLSGRNAKGVSRLDSAKALRQRAFQGADVILTWAPTAIATGLSSDRRVVLVSHGVGEWWQRSLASAAPQAGRFVSVSAGARDAFPPSIREKVTVIYNGVELDRLTPLRERSQQRTMLMCTDDTIVVGYVGRWSDDKYPAAAALAVREIGPRAVALFHTPYRPDDAEVSAVMEMCRGRCRFIHDERIGDSLNAMDCVVSASDHEGFGLSTVEAWAAGVPVVSTPVGVVPEAEREHGTLTTKVPPRAPADVLASAVLQAISPAGRAMAQRARDVAWSEYTAARMSGAWFDYLIERST